MLIMTSEFCCPMPPDSHLQQDLDGEDASEAVVEVGQLLVPVAVGIDRIFGCESYRRTDDDLERNLSQMMMPLTNFNRATLCRFHNTNESDRI